MSLILPWTNRKTNEIIPNVKVLSHIAVSFAKESQGCVRPAYLTVARSITREVWMLNNFLRISEYQTLADSFNPWLPCLWVYDSLIGILRVHLIILCKSPYCITLMTILLYTHSSSKLKLPYCILSCLPHLLILDIFVLFPSHFSQKNRFKITYAHKQVTEWRLMFTHFHMKLKYHQILQKISRNLYWYESDILETLLKENKSSKGNTRRENKKGFKFWLKVA